MVDPTFVKSAIIALRKSKAKITEISAEEKELKAMKKYYERVIIKFMQQEDMDEIKLSKSGRKIVLDKKYKKIGLKKKIKERLLEFYEGNDKKAKNLYKYLCNREDDDFEVKKVFKEKKNK